MYGIPNLMSDFTGRVVGYARVSTEEQSMDLQLDALKAVGCDHIFTDQGISAIAKKRVGFEQAIDALQPNDIFVIWKMDRAFRSLRHALDVLEQFENQNIQFRALTEQIDTTTPMGKCMYQIRNAFAELERNLISECTKAGMHAARKRGKHIGRPRKLTEDKILWAKSRLQSDKNLTITQVAKELAVSRRTLAYCLELDN
jgi:DNA invertase Pin-like site-specific DNA recombinase